MKYLVQLLNALQSIHWQQLEGISFSATEKQLLAYLKQHPTLTDENSNELTTQLDLTDGHLRKVTSGLLRKILNELGGESIEALIVLLGRLRLHQLLKHEIKRKEKELKAAGDEAQLSQLYLHAVEPFLHSVATDIDDKFIKGLIVGYRSLSSIDEAQALKLELQRLSTVTFAASVKHTAGSKAFKSAGAFVQQELVRIDATKEVHADALATYWLYKTWKYYYEIFEINQEAELKQLETLTDLVTRHPEGFKPQYRVYPRVNMAEILIDQSRFQEAFDMFEQVFADEPELMFRWISYIDKYAQVSMVLGKYTLAKSLVIKGYHLPPEAPWEGKSDMYVQHLYLAIIDMMTNDNDTAFKHLQIAKERSEKSEFFWVEVLLRTIEQAYFFLTGEFELSENLLQKNMRFLNYYPADSQLQLFKDFHQFIGACLALQTENKTLSAQNLQQFNELQIGHLAFLGVLLKKVRAMVDKTYQIETAQ